MLFTEFSDSPFAKTLVIAFAYSNFALILYQIEEYDLVHKFSQ